MTPLRAVRAVLSWLFGFALTVTLIATWGQSVSDDTRLLADAGAELAAAEVVVDWAETTAAEAAAATLGVEEAAVRPLVEEAFAGEVGEQALRSLVAAVIDAATAPPGSEREVDVAAHLEPLADHLVSELTGAGVDLDPARVEEALAAIDPIAVEVSGDRPPLGPGSTTSSGLFVATVAGLATVLASAAGLVATTIDRRRELRSLVSRVAVSALTFALLLQVGAWLTDPGGGRMPVRAAVATALGAKVWVPALIGVLAASVSGLLWWLRHGSGRRTPHPAPDRSPPVAEAVVVSGLEPRDHARV